MLILKGQLIVGLLHLPVQFFRPLFMKRFLPILLLLPLTVSSSKNELIANTASSQLTSIINTEFLAGGETTVKINTANAFSQKSKNLTDSKKVLLFNMGNDFFENPWIEGSASTSSRDGLGGLFNNNACQDCHVRDGRGHAPTISATENGTDFSTILLRAIKSDITPQQKNAMENGTLANVADTSVGGQLQHQSIANVKKEVELSVAYQNKTVSFKDGFEVELRKPSWHIKSTYAEAGYDINPDTVFSVRVASQMIGLGLLSFIPTADIITQADENDSDKDGISGKPNFVWSNENNKVQLGRFGWKAGQPTLIDQNASAFINDMGLTSRIITQENCLAHQVDCLAAENGNGDIINQYEYEVADKVLEAVTFYSSHLSVPQRRHSKRPDILAGKTLFNSIGCASCHTPQYQTADDATFPELSNQTIYPYTDMLLHDMGAALADIQQDNSPANKTTHIEYQANAHEWRTPPLWGLGLVQTVDPKATFLHDGRARNILEAILWHGGEAKEAQQAVLALNKVQRDQLMAFLNDL